MSSTTTETPVGPVRLVADTMGREVLVVPDDMARRLEAERRKG